ncbi:competence/damage-inducible protein A [Clostridiaceae bacterium UIB06]|uniref:Putative competence-damage inducible protein n=1 Tax=Clostridium thailandense TaxID=2794346 RepID=A0A949TRT1_9CLOT|nr:competence/damage-inducible protein A [Clostridium thailandense]MBV7272141.1 competence/damage-inducible protein A [Clostridium thailandense]MCH5136007.1 competence/damage-inducible protein A [Clostridiaceae bacterium UIB06]
MKAEILCVGTELLLGDIVNTNAQYLSKRLADLGIFVYHQSVVGDNSERLKEEFKAAFDRADIIITTGGLGPTPDDLTKETGAEYFNKKMILHEETLDKLKSYFIKTERDKLQGNNIKQAYFPEDSLILPNSHGTAPGCVIDENGKILIVLPGPPREMKPMFEDYVVPFLENYSNIVIQSKVLRICGIGEGLMAEQISDIMTENTNPTVAPYAKDWEVTLRITAKASTKEAANNLIIPVEDEIRQRLGLNIYGEGETSLEAVLGELLIKSNFTISTAESCTGGLIASKLVNYPGISSVFMEGAVTYSNDAKMRRLGVKSETLETFGAVSEETAREMAEGIAKTANTNIGLSTTGIAGPDGGTQEKPVGLVYVGLSINGITKTIKLQLSGSREMIRRRTTITALDWVRRELLKSNQ